MSEFVAISSLFVKPDEMAHVGARFGSEADLSRFAEDVAANAARIRASGRRLATLIAEENYWFAVGFLAALHAGAELLLPPNGLPATLGGLDLGDSILLRGPGDPVDRAHDLAAAAPASLVLGPLDPETCRLAFFTSGSTGVPKRVDKRLVHLEREVAALAGRFGSLTTATRTVSTVACHHIYGLLFTVLWPLATRRPMPDRPMLHWSSALPAIDGQSILVASPAHLSRLDGVEALPIERRPRAIFSSGGPLAFAAAKECEGLLGSLPFEVFGSTETGGVAYRQQSDTDTLWTPFHGIDVAVAPEGVLRVKSPYFDEPYLDMGDAAEIDSSGKFRVGPRLDRIVKIEGKRVALGEIEAVLRSDDRVAGAAALPGNGGRSAIDAVVALSPKGRAAFDSEGPHKMSQALRRLLAERFDGVLLPRRWRFVESLPVNAQGKTTLADLAALFSAETGSTRDRPRDPEVLRLAREGNRATVDLLVPQRLVFFDGHFRGRPILPGVVQLTWALDLAHAAFGASKGWGAHLKVKFKKIIEPGEALSLVLMRRPNGLAVDFEYRGENGVKSQGTLGSGDA